MEVDVVKCVICDENINKLRPLVTCPYCKKTCCRRCYQRYCLDSTQPSCMHCKKAHNTAFFRENVTRTYYNSDFQSALRVLLFDEEKAMFPQTLDWIEKMEVCKARHTAVRQRIEELQEQLREACAYRDRLFSYITRLNLGENVDIDAEEDKKSDEEPQAKQTWHKSAYGCSTPDCRGLVIRNKCSICGNVCCPTCRVQLGPGTLVDYMGSGHLCNPETVATVKAIADETKPCPKCNVPIFKIDGCTVMWCTACNTGFSWTTGQLLKHDQVHNPHFFDYLHNLGRDTRYINQICGNLEYNQRVLSMQWNRVLDITRTGSARWLYMLTLDIGRFEARLDANITHSLREASDPNSVDVRRHRVAYLNSTLSVEQYRRFLSNRFRKSQRLGELAPIYRMLVNIIIDILHRGLIDADNIDRALGPAHLVQQSREMATRYKNEVLAAIRIANDALFKFQQQWRVSTQYVCADLNTASDLELTTESLARVELLE